MSGSERAARDLRTLTEIHKHAPTLGCSLTSHRDLGFCAACCTEGATTEVAGWRLLAMAERGIPDQPWEVAR